MFVPSLTARRFPSSRTGQKKNWLVPRDRFPASRYEGSDADERRLFYVALTPARDRLSVSRHARTAKQAATSSPYLNGMSQHEVDPVDVVLPYLEPGAQSDEPLALSYSELASYLSCGLAYRLRTLIGFQPPRAAHGRRDHPRHRQGPQCSMRTQLLCAPAYLDPELAATVSWTWSGPSRACHHHAYDLAPTAVELNGWIDGAGQLIEEVRGSASEAV